MQDSIFTDIPVQYERIANATKALAFNMASDLYTGSLLKTLVASKGTAKILELGTGSGLATSWIVAGMRKDAKLVTIDNNALLMDIARQNLADERVCFVCADGYEWLQTYKGDKFDLIFADAMPGKYDLFEEALALLRIGGFYIIDDMLPQLNWPDGHAAKAEKFIDVLENRKDITLTKLNWSTGIIIAVKTADKEF
ncbi:O-methyltransferase [Foetidibacter luteolus]|uniref:O-methyltransferase n=1 Tax=Foetidibacter luteolus TaxID=2608880 RepID=UPI00129B0C70|nr:class I SAM-dependent methyltransferase [Foetidibacter luteolus]